MHDSYWGRIHQRTGLVRGPIGVALQWREVHDKGMTYHFNRNVKSRVINNQYKLTLYNKG